MGRSGPQKRKQITTDLRLYLSDFSATGVQGLPLDYMGK